MERETGFEPATSTLARSHSTTELFPLTGPYRTTGPAAFNPGTAGIACQTRCPAPYQIRGVPEHLRAPPPATSD